MATRRFPAGDPDVLYLVDLSGYVHRAFHAMEGLESPSGEPTNATLGTVTMLERLIRECRPALLGLALDSRGKTFRHDLYAGYKAHRPPQPPELSRQVRRIEELVDAFHVAVLQCPGFEADDLIATAVRRARELGLRVVIVSADKDLMQLVGDDVLLWDTMRDRVVGPAEVEERFGVGPELVRDALALIGDSSDNVPGVPHVGPKTAAELLTRFGSLDSLLSRLDEVDRKKLRENLSEHAEQARLSRRLVTLDDRCPVTLERETFAVRPRDVARLRALYTELGFQRLLLGLESSAQGTLPLGASASPAVPATRPVEAAAPGVRATCLEDGSALAHVVAAARSAGHLALRAVTGEPVRGEAPLFGLGLAVTPEEGFYLPLAHRALGAPTGVAPSAVREHLLPLLVDPSLPKVTHDSKHDRVALVRAGLGLEGVKHDTLLAHYLLDAEARHTITALAEGELGLSLPTADALRQRGRGQRVGLDELAPAQVAEVAAREAAALLGLAPRLASRLEDEGLADLHRRVELPLAPLLARMELTGVGVDVSRLAELGRRIEQELVGLEQRAHAAAGRTFNLASPRQLEVLLFDELGLKPLKRTKTSRSTDAETLEALAEHHELPGILLEHRQLAKLKGTYLDALPQLINPRTGRLHTRWEQAVAATGRISSTDPNLQNIPIRSELGRAIRAAFVAPPGHRMVSADYSQIELRVLAHLSRDPVLLEAFRTGEDVHQRTAMEIFEVGAESVTPELRRRAKAVNFGVVYGQGEGGLARSLGIPRQEAARFIAAYFRRYHGVRSFMNDTLQSARESEQVRTLLGRRRLVPEIRSANRARRLAAERVAMNTPIQGTAADILKLAMLRLAEPPSPGARLVLTVHDELVFEVPEAEVQEASERIRLAMEQAHPLDVPLPVEVRHGASWSEAH